MDILWDLDCLDHRRAHFYDRALKIERKQKEAV
jgi:hypothetical protein